MSDSLEKQKEMYEWFLENLKELAITFPQKEILITEHNFQIFDDLMEALREGEMNYGMGNFIVQHCVDPQPIHYSKWV